MSARIYMIEDHRDTVPGHEEMDEMSEQAQRFKDWKRRHTVCVEEAKRVDYVPSIKLRFLQWLRGKK